MATVARRVGDLSPMKVQMNLGKIPVMVRSAACHLYGLKSEELIRRKEDSNELGGYFIINGNERLIRLVINRRRNVVIGEVRSFFMKKNKDFTPYATVIRGVRPDHSGNSVRVHYLTNGSLLVGFYLNKIEYFTPAGLLLHCLAEVSDWEIYDAIVQKTHDSFFLSRAEILIRDAQQYPSTSQVKAIAYLGETFRIVLRLPEELTDFECGQYFLNKYIFVHCANGRQKFDLLCYMIRKLFYLVTGKIKPENLDALNCHEVLLPGHAYLLYIKATIQRALALAKSSLITEIKKKADVSCLHQDSVFRRVAEDHMGISLKFSNFLATGNVSQTLSIELPQYSGLTIMAERLNHLRFLAHFRSVHRGQFFTEMKTTGVRKLLPESWGFLCPVHTPDGTPCGLLNHLAAKASIVTHHVDLDEGAFSQTLSNLGMIPVSERMFVPESHIPVLLNGIVLGHVPKDFSTHFASQLRYCKVHKLYNVPNSLEIAAVHNFDDFILPSITLSTEAARLIRPVIHLGLKKTELISPMEQLYLDIAVTPEEIIKDHSTHRELSPMSMLSMLASCTPFSDFNQSPRNMYQCQMAKQTMGTPYHCHPFRTDNKVYRIQTPQKPLVRTTTVSEFGLDDHAVGTNAVVAVISYTGFDMEDAMIINKSAYERGLKHGSVYTSIVEDLTPKRVFGANMKQERFSNVNPVTKKPLSFKLDSNGLPHVGSLVRKGDPLFCVVDLSTGKHRITKHKSSEPAYVDSVNLVAPGEIRAQKAVIKLRYNRNPVIGDKFSSRHGQKGVLSQLWPQIDMPFSENGITPDIIINPHAFPSRMTIGMLIESMAGKAGCLDGQEQDASPFQFDENNLAVDEFGQKLLKHGYHYLGNETMTSGVSGMPFEADIFIGVVHYQRLRHMVSDKSQVRALGPVNTVTRQPIHGRKHGGGIRFGEMERDSLIAHGASFLLQDRLFNCSDKHVVGLSWKSNSNLF